LVGCGTERTIIRSNPSGATVTINNRTVGTTPVEYAVNRSDWPVDNTFLCRLDLEGYGPADCTFRGARWRHIIGEINTLGLIRIFRGPYGLSDEYRFELRRTSLWQLDDLRTRGVITDDEYKQLRLDLIRKAIDSGKPLPE